MNRGGISRAPRGRMIIRPFALSHAGFKKPYGWPLGRGSQFDNTIVATPGQLSLNVATLLGNPTGNRNVLVVIPLGVLLGSTGATVPSLDASGLSAASNLTVRIFGSVQGAGGTGATNFTIGPGVIGQTGGIAIKTRCPTKILNQGSIISGGGAGGGPGQAGSAGAAAAGGAGGAGGPAGSAIDGIAFVTFLGPQGTITGPTA
jgi:hypothetical protein